MKPRHVAALALVGWYLLLPPLTPNGYPSLVDTAQSLTKWQNVGTFDNESDCKRGLKKFAYEASKKPADMAAMTPGQAVQSDLVRSWSAKCVASDDPRLASH